jgi:hypothetical protein
MQVRGLLGETNQKDDSISRGNHCTLYAKTFTMPDLSAMCVNVQMPHQVCLGVIILADRKLGTTPDR